MASIVAWKNVGQIGKPKCIPSFRPVFPRRIIADGHIKHRPVKLGNATTILPNNFIRSTGIAVNVLTAPGTRTIVSIKSLSNQKHETHMNIFTFGFPFGTRSFVVEPTPSNNKKDSSQTDEKPMEAKPEESSYFWRILPSMGSYSGNRLWKYAGVSKRFIGGDLMKRFRDSKSDSRRRYKMSFDQFVVFFQFFTIGMTGVAIISTTAIISLLLLFANYFDFDDYITKFVSRTLTNSTGIIITYDSAKGSLWNERIIKLKKSSRCTSPSQGDRKSQRYRPHY